MEFIQTLEAKGLKKGRVFIHVAMNAAPTVLAVSGLQIGYLLGGSILVETVFSWPGTGFFAERRYFQERHSPTTRRHIGISDVFCSFKSLS